MKTGLAKGTLYLTISSGIFIVVGYLTNILLGRFLGPITYGNYGVIVSLVSLINMIQTSGLTQSVAKYIAENESLTDAIMKSALTLQIITTGGISILFFFASPLIADALNDTSLTMYLQLASLSFPIYGIYALMIDYHNGRHYFKKQALLTSIYSVTKAIFVLGFGYFFHLIGVLWGFILAPLLALFFGFYYPKRVSHFPYKKLLFFSLPLIGYILFSTLLQSIDLYFVKALLSSEKAGFYTASQNISRILYFGTIAFSAVLLPSISRSVKQGRNDKTKKTISITLRLVLLLIAPLIALIAALSKEILVLLYASAYVPASESLTILAVSFGFFTLFSLLCTLLIAAGKPTMTFFLAILGLLLNIFLCTILIPKFSLTGAALASLISNGIVLCYAAFFVYRTHHVLLAPTRVLRILGSALILFFVAKTITGELLLLPFYMVILLLGYLFLLIITKELTRHDLTLFQEIK